MQDFGNLHLLALQSVGKRGTNGSGAVEFCVVGTSVMCLVSVIQFNGSQ